MKKEIKSKEVTQKMLMKSLDFAYDKAINGIPGFDSAQELAANYIDNEKDALTNCDSLIKWQIAKAGTSGFLTGLGGLITMPITIPVNLASVLFVQIRMIAAIAYIGGYDIKDDRVKSLVYLCMTGNAAKDIVKDIGIVFGKKISTQMIKSISGKTISKINQKVGFRLFTKFGEKGLINGGKVIPLVGGVIGGLFDGATTSIIGNIAQKTFIETI
jgi:hypothetical protein